MDSKFMQKFMEIGGRIGGQKHMTAIRDGFALTMPLIMVGAFAVMINNVFLAPGGLVGNYFNDPEAPNAFFTFTGTYLSPWFAALDPGTLSLTSLALVATLAYTRANQEDADPITTVIVALGAFFVLGPVGRATDFQPWISNYFGAMGIMVALFTGLVAPAIYIAITNKGWTIKMPEMVPPAVGKGFAAIIPGLFAIGTFALAPAILTILTANGTMELTIAETVPTVFLLVEQNVQSVLFNWFGSSDPSMFFQGLGAAVAIDFLKQLFWFFGLHGSNLIAVVLNPIWGNFDVLNMQAFVADGANAVLYPWSSSSWTIYVSHGGSGATLGLLIALFLFNKRPDSKEIAKLSVPSGMFQINEPVTFGIPMVLNPTYAIPFLFVSPLLTAIAYTSVVKFGFGEAVVNVVPWTAPPIIGTFLATNGSWSSVLLSIITLAIATLCYAPFVKLANKQFEEESSSN